MSDFNASYEFDNATVKENGTMEGVVTAIFQGYWGTRIIFNGIFGIIFEIFGIIGNIISIVVLAHYNKRSSTPLLLIFLAVFDAIFLFAEMFLEQWTLLSKVGLITAAYRPFITPIYVLFYPVPRIALTASMIMTVLITLERYIAVVHPLRASRMCSKSIAWKAIFLVTIWSIFFNLPQCLAYTSVYQWNNSTNTSKLHFVRTIFGEGWFYNNVYQTWITSIFLFILPFVVIALLNIQLLISIRQSRALATEKSKSSKSLDGRLTAMVFAVTTMFFVCGLLYSVAQIMVIRLNKYSEASVELNNYIAITDTLIIFNCAVNFILYCVVGRKFRNIFMNVFCRKKKDGYPIKTINTKSTSYHDSQDKELHSLNFRKKVIK